MLSVSCDTLIFFWLYIADLSLNCINDTYFILNFEIIKSGNNETISLAIITCTNIINYANVG